MKISKTLIDESNITNAKLILFSASLDGSLVVMIKEVIDTAFISFKKEIRFVEILDFENNSIKVVVLDQSIISFTGIYFRGNGHFFIGCRYNSTEKIIEFNRSGEIVDDNHELFKAYLNQTNPGNGYTLKNFIIHFFENDIVLFDLESLKIASIGDFIKKEINRGYYFYEWFYYGDEYEIFYTNRNNIFCYCYYSKDDEESAIVIFKINGLNDVELLYKTITQEAVFRCFLNEENDEIIYESRQNRWDDTIHKIVKISDPISQSKISNLEEDYTQWNDFLDIEYSSDKFLIIRAFNTYKNYNDLLIFNRSDFRLLKTIVIGGNKNQYDVDGNPKPLFDKGYHYIGENHIFYVNDSKLNVLSLEDLEK